MLGAFRQFDSCNLLLDSMQWLISGNKMNSKNMCLFTVLVLFCLFWCFYLYIARIKYKVSKEVKIAQLYK